MKTKEVKKVKEVEEIEEVEEVVDSGTTYSVKDGKTKHVRKVNGKWKDTSDSRIIITQKGIEIYYGVTTLIRRTVHTFNKNRKGWRQSSNT